LLQADLDMQSATLHCDEKDYKTAYSYFYESFENLNTLGDPRAVQCLKWMLLCKIMTNIAEDVQALVNGKLALRFAGSELEAMRAIASAHSNSSLKQFKSAIETYKHELQDDALIHRHLSALYDTLLEQNLLRIIEPFSQVQINHAAELIELPPALVERKLSQMILDKKLRGILDQGNNCLIVFDEPEVDHTYQHGLSTVTSMGRVVDRLYKKAAKLS
jgi:26S proteasome regulatory subunit N6